MSDEARAARERLKTERTIEREKRKLLGRIKAALRAQLERMVVDRQDHLIAVVASGGGIRLGIEIALPVTEDQEARLRALEDAAAGTPEGEERPGEPNGPEPEQRPRIEVVRG